MCGVKDQAGHRSSPVYKLLHLRRASPLWEAPARSLLQRKDCAALTPTATASPALWSSDRLDGSLPAHE